MNRSSPRSSVFAHSILLCLILAGSVGCKHTTTAPIVLISKTVSVPVPVAQSKKAESNGVKTASAFPPRFIDIAASAGLDYRWTIPGAHPHTILQTMGNGCAFLDYDNDGNLDILLVGPKLALYRGDGHGHFTDVTKQTELDKFSGHFFGCAVGDYDNDGYPDIYISGYRTALLLHNEAAGHRGNALAKRPGNDMPVDGQPVSRRIFRDVTAEAGLAPQPWGTSCGFADLNNDGFLDLYVANYVDYDPQKPPQLCDSHGIKAACGPHYYHPLKGVLYFNQGGHRFRDVTKETGASAQNGNGLGVAFADYNSSGHVSLAIVDDEIASNLFQNQGNGRLQEIGIASGMAINDWGATYAGMGVDWGDYDNDGRLDLFVTTFFNEPKSLFHNNENGTFTDKSQKNGIAHATLKNLAFGAKFLDADNDGWLDILIANGHVNDNVAILSPKQSYRQQMQFLHNEGGADPRFSDLSKNAGLDKLPKIVGRGLAVGDFDNDGLIDALVVDSEGAPLLLHNVTQHAGHWAGFRLIGTGKSNRDAYGAIVTVEITGRKLMRQCQSAGSYLSASDPRVHFGLGKATVLDRVTVVWPDGKRQQWEHLKADRYVTLTEK